VLVPFAHTEIPDPDFPYHSGEKWYEEPGRAFVGLSGESRTADANSPFFRTQVGGGPTTLVSTGEAGDRLFSQLDLPILGVRPARPDSAPVYRPNVPCENQEPPDLNAPGGPAPEQTSAEPTLPLPRASAARERARPELYRRLREYVSRTSRGLPALDPFVWWGLGERTQLRRMGLMRNEQGRIVKREAGR
jgi:phospholipid/cholesterol/gamma-HCH transport system substrate-binding protein